MNTGKIRILWACIALIAVFSLASYGSNGPMYVETGKELSITKTANPATVTKAGEVITYTYKVENNIDATAATDFQISSITGIAIEDSPLDGPVNCPKAGLALGESMMCTAMYTVTDADVENGGIINNASVTGEFTSVQKKGSAMHDHTASASAKAEVTAGMPVSDA